MKWMIPSVIAITVWSAIGTLDYPTWFFELMLGFAGVVLLVALHKRFPFTGVVHILVVIHFLVLAIGAKYTYAEAPPGEWLKSLFGFTRNHFDRVGHFMQGFVPAMIVREVLLRKTNLERGWWTSVLVVCFCLAFSAFYELIEWWMVIFFYPDAGPEWLGHQGDPWDAQADMFMAFSGAILSQLSLSWLQDRQWVVPTTPRPPERSETKGEDPA